MAAPMTLLKAFSTALHLASRTAWRSGSPWVPQMAAPKGQRCRQYIHSGRFPSRHMSSRHLGPRCEARIPLLLAESSQSKPQGSAEHSPRDPEQSMARNYRGMKYSHPRLFRLSLCSGSQSSRSRHLRHRTNACKTVDHKPPRPPGATARPAPRLPRPWPPDQTPWLHTAAGCCPYTRLVAIGTLHLFRQNCKPGSAAMRARREAPCTERLDRRRRQRDGRGL